MASTTSSHAIITEGPQGSQGGSAQNAQSDFLSEASRARIENWRTNVEGPSRDGTVPIPMKTTETERTSQKPQEKAVTVDEETPTGVRPLISKALLHAVAFIAENA